MFRNEVNTIGVLASSKVNHMKNHPARYFTLTLLAGMFIGFGVLLDFSLGAMLTDSHVPGVKIFMGLAFGVALSLVIISGGELFTGNNLTMSVGIYTKNITVTNSFALWIFCWLGNLIGSIILAFIFAKTGLLSGSTASFIANSTLSKISLSTMEMFCRAVLCNTLVCLATWCSIKMKSESGKLIMIFWCIFAFVTSGFEHSIANMSIFSLALINPAGADITMSSCLYNLFIVSLGNMIGGIFLVGLPYSISSKYK